MDSSPPGYIGQDIFVFPSGYSKPRQKYDNFYGNYKQKQEYFRLMILLFLLLSKSSTATSSAYSTNSGSNGRWKLSKLSSWCIKV
jgi:hypothetical protein